MTLRRWTAISIAGAAIAFLAAAGASSADTFTLNIVSQTATTITYGWTPQPGYGYLYSTQASETSPWVVVGRTNNANASQFTFQKGSYDYEVAVLVKGATGKPVKPACNNKLDDDNDGLIDFPADPGCTSSSDTSEVDAVGPPTATFTISPAAAAVGQAVTFDWTGACPAGGCTAVWEDEGPDGPGGTDWPWAAGDPLVKTFESVGTKYVHLVVTDSAGATAESRQQLAVAASPPPLPQCSDGVDNADPEDTLIDMADPGCTGPLDNDETDPGPPPSSPQCSDGIDNADPEDTLADYPADPGCTGVNDDDETDTAPPGPSNITVSTSGNDSTCSRGGSACRTIPRAYALAQSGDTIGVDGGSYAGFTLGGSKAVTIATDPGEVASFTSRVVLDGLQNATIRGPFSTKPAYNHTQDVKDFSVDGCSRNLNLYDIRAGLFDVTGSADNISFFGGDFGGYTDTNQEDSWIGGDGSSCGDGGIVSNLLFDGIYLHDVLYVSESQWGDSHPDCLQTGGLLDGMTMRNSRVMRCGNSFFGFYGDFGNFTNLLIENNLFYGIKDSYWGFNIDPKSRSCSIVVRYNTYQPDNAVSGGYAYSPPSILCQTRQVYGNIFQAGEPGGCGSGTGWTFNVFEITADGRDPCGSNTTVGPVQYVDRVDYRLAAGSLALGKGDPSRFPSTDFEGTPRSSPPDAGWDER